VQAAYPEDSRQERFERMFAELLKRGTTNSAAHASAAGPGGWLYRFDLPVQKIPDLGATHGAEIAFTFNALAGGAPDSAFFYGRNDPVVRKLALDWSNTVIQFARTGNPNGAGLPDWPQYTVETREALILDDNPRIAADLNQADRARWGDTEKTSAELR
jgi:para-nitrobenzyl esterase